MRLAPITLSAALVLATMASAGHGQKPDDDLNPRSVALVQQGESLAASGQYQAANDALETALAVDPRNRAAYIGLAHVAQGQKLPGKAIGLYAEALKLEPNDPVALAGQGAAMVERGAVERAKLNLEKLKTACNGACPQSATLAALIAKGPPPEAVAIAVVPEPAATTRDN